MTSTSIIATHNFAVREVPNMFVGKFTVPSEHSVRVLLQVPLDFGVQDEAAQWHVVSFASHLLWRGLRTLETN